MTKTEEGMSELQSSFFFFFGARLATLPSTPVFFIAETLKALKRECSREHARAKQQQQKRNWQMKSWTSVKRESKDAQPRSKAVNSLN